MRWIIEHIFTRVTWELTCAELRSFWLSFGPHHGLWTFRTIGICIDVFTGTCMQSKPDKFSVRFWNAACGVFMAMAHENGRVYMPSTTSCGWLVSRSWHQSRTRLDSSMWRIQSWLNSWSSSREQILAFLMWKGITLQIQMSATKMRLWKYIISENSKKYTYR